MSITFYTFRVITDLFFLQVTSMFPERSELADSEHRMLPLRNHMGENLRNLYRLVVYDGYII